MTTVPILQAPQRRWECPSCGRQHVDHAPPDKAPVHPCAGLAGVIAPFVEVTGLDLNRRAVRHRVIERDDYVADERGLRTDANGRVVSAVSTDRADGSNDLHVFAPIAFADFKEMR